MQEEVFKSSSPKEGYSEAQVAKMYFLVMREDGNMYCSCGAPISKIDDNTYKCSRGWPIYRPEDGEVMIDKFGNTMLKIKPHGVSES